mmetsp:Transcript_19711/g.47065  ORF Transcript_19711/g.47065 Transcript_19711/m.47065 type:complete len:82 (+) Transcript_19711:1000-1245(+)
MVFLQCIAILLWKIVLLMHSPALCHGGQRAAGLTPLQYSGACSKVQHCSYLMLHACNSSPNLCWKMGFSANSSLVAALVQL